MTDLRPYQIVPTLYGEVECISYPFVETDKDGMETEYIMVRMTVGDCTTMEQRPTFEFLVGGPKPSAVDNEPEPEPYYLMHWCDTSVGGCCFSWQGGSHPCENGSYADDDGYYITNYCGSQRCPSCGTCQGALANRLEDKARDIARLVDL